MKNVGTLDRVLRIVIGLGLISLVFIGPKTLWGWIGAILVVTGAVSWCPIYRIFGLRTCRIQSQVKTQ